MADKQTLAGDDVMWVKTSLATHRKKKDQYSTLHLGNIFHFAIRTGEDVVSMTAVEGEGEVLRSFRHTTLKHHRFTRTHCDIIWEGPVANRSWFGCSSLGAVDWRHCRVLCCNMGKEDKVKSDYLKQTEYTVSCQKINEMWDILQSTTTQYYTIFNGTTEQ